MSTKKTLPYLAASLALLVVGASSSVTDAASMRASWYGKQFHGRLMANGHRFNMFDPTTVAHKSFPFGTKLRLTNPKTGKSIRVVVRDRGPYIRGRQLDLSFAAAKVLGFVSSGTAALKVERLN